MKITITFSPAERACIMDLIGSFAVLFPQGKSRSSRTQDAHGQLHAHFETPELLPPEPQKTKRRRKRRRGRASHEGTPDETT